MLQKLSGNSCTRSYSYIPIPSIHVIIDLLQVIAYTYTYVRTSIVYTPAWHNMHSCWYARSCTENTIQLLLLLVYTNMFLIYVLYTSKSGQVNGVRLSPELYFSNLHYPGHQGPTKPRRLQAGKSYSCRLYYSNVPYYNLQLNISSNRFKLIKFYRCRRLSNDLEPASRILHHRHYSQLTILIRQSTYILLTSSQSKTSLFVLQWISVISG